ncbi:ROK family transcriptional regulator [Jatrophihabitans sp.]|jgi:predicted NBD/HSP70 family sugar kinase|uniref:ROK family transcriptional regulator n=1 Tax=Jatrophihabitans sp. TaxID=1932789 RepID=UPI002EFA49B9
MSEDWSGDGPAALSNSAGEVFQLFRAGIVRTRRELIQYSGLARSTVTGRVDALIEAGLLREAGENLSTGGRPPKILVPNLEAKTILAADLGATHGRIAVLDGAGTIIVETALESRIQSGPAAVLARLVRQWQKLLRRSGRELSSLCGIGLGLPGPVDAETGRLVQPPIMPGWHDHPIREYLGRHFDVPAFVENDANLMALGESQLVHPTLPSLLLVKVATGIGAGLILDGRIYSGAAGGAGDIGHVKVPAAAGLRCSCGAEGCLAAVSSGAALVRQLAAAGRAVSTSRDVVQLVQQGDPEAVALTRRAGQILGEVIATAVSLFNPSALILGGDLSLTDDHFLSGLREVLYQRTQPLAIRHLLVSTSKLGDEAGIAGAAALVRQEVFSAAAVDRALSRSPG